MMMSATPSIASWSSLADPPTPTPTPVEVTDAASGDLHSHSSDKSRSLLKFPSVRSLLHEGEVWVLGRQPCDCVEDHYQLHKVIGEPGSYGTCYLATERATGEECVVKMISKEPYRTRPEALVRFRHEIEAMRLCNHPNIVRFRDALETPDHLYIVMEACTGGDLIEDIIANYHKKRTFTEQECRVVIKQLLAGLNYMHERHLVHLDLKPDNLAYASPTNRTIKLLDFGMACLWDPAKSFTQLAGTPSYASPEIVNRNFGAAADMWSVGVIAFSMLYGYLPFNCNLSRVSREQQPHAIKRNVLQGFSDEVKAGRGPWFPRDRSDVSPLARDLIARLLKYNVADRLTAKEALEHGWMLEDMTSLKKSSSLQVASVRSVASSPSSSAAPHATISPSLLRGLLQYNARTQLHQAALVTMRDSLSPVERYQLRQSWLALDMARDGMVSRAQFRQAMKAYPVEQLDCQVYGRPETKVSPLDDETIDSIFDMVDVDGDEQISCRELECVAVHLRLVGRRERLHQAFAKLDANGDGRISADELMAVLDIDRASALAILQDCRRHHCNTRSHQHHHDRNASRASSSIVSSSVVELSSVAVSDSPPVLASPIRSLPVSVEPSSTDDSDDDDANDSLDYEEFVDLWRPAGVTKQPSAI